MKTLSFLTACALLALVPLASGQEKRKKKEKNAPAATPVPAPETGFGLFRMVRLKNVFDPDRRPMPTEGVAKAPPPSGAAGNRNSYLILTGTMVTETKRLAFFSGSSSDYNRVVRAKDKLGDCVVEAISTSHVDLKRGDQAITLAVGKMLTLDRAAGGGASISATPAPSEEAPASVSSPAVPNGVPSATPAAQVGDPLDANAILRRMMERRRTETK